MSLSELLACSIPDDDRKPLPKWSGTPLDEVDAIEEAHRANRRRTDRSLSARQQIWRFTTSEWRTTGEIAGLVGIARTHAGCVLADMRRVGLVERGDILDGYRTWRRKQ